MPAVTEKNTWAEKFSENDGMDSKSGCAEKLFAHPVALGDAPGGPLDRDGVEVEEAGKGHAFDEMWGVK